MNIQMISRQTGLSTHTLRYYEKIGIVFEAGELHTAGESQVPDQFLKHRPLAAFAQDQQPRIDPFQNHLERTEKQRVVFLGIQPAAGEDQGKITLYKGFIGFRLGYTPGNQVFVDPVEDDLHPGFGEIHQLEQAPLHAVGAGCDRPGRWI